MERLTRMVARPGRDAVGRNLRAFEKAWRGGDLDRLAEIQVTDITDNKHHEIGQSGHRSFTGFLQQSPASWLGTRNHEVDLPAPALAAYEPLVPVRDGRLGTRSARPSRPGPARPDGGNRGTTRSSGRGPQRRCPRSLAGRDRSSWGQGPVTSISLASSSRQRFIPTPGSKRNVFACCSMVPNCSPNPAFNPRFCVPP